MLYCAFFISFPHAVSKRVIIFTISLFPGWLYPYRRTQVYWSDERWHELCQQVSVTVCSPVFSELLVNSVPRLGYGRTSIMSNKFVDFGVVFLYQIVRHCLCFENCLSSSISSFQGRENKISKNDITWLDMLDMWMFASCYLPTFI